jgi:hypothetical protein
MNDVWQRLKAPFPPDKVSWRLGATKKDKTSGIALAYIDARDVMERLDEIVGPENWQNKYSHAEGKTVCDIGVQFSLGNWVWKADGAGDSDVEAEKGALSDAFKRAAVRFGIGRYLYDLGNTWVEIEQHGNSYAIKSSEYAKLKNTLARNFPAPSPQTAQESKPAMSIVNGTPGASKAAGRETYNALVKEIRNALSVSALTRWFTENAGKIDALPTDWVDELRIEYLDKQSELKKGLAA